MDRFLHVSGGSLAVPCQKNIHVLLSYLEYLHCNNLSKPVLINCMDALKPFHIMYGLDPLAFKYQKLPLFIKLIQNSAPFNPGFAPYFAQTSLKIFSTFVDFFIFRDI